MEALVYRNQKGGDVTTSIKISEVFGKRHSDVLRDLRNLSCSNEFRERNFALMFIFRDLPNGGKKQEDYYEITRDGFSFLVMGYTGEKASKFKEDFILEFNKRESLLNSDEYIVARALEIASNRTRQLERQLVERDILIGETRKVIELQAPKVVYYDKVINTENIFPISKIALQAGMTAVKLNEILRMKGVQKKIGGTWLLTSKYIGMGYADLKTGVIKGSGDREITTHHLQWTEKGREFILNLIGTTNH